MAAVVWLWCKKRLLSPHEKRQTSAPCAPLGARSAPCGEHLVVIFVHVSLVVGEERLVGYCFSRVEGGQSKELLPFCEKFES